MIRLTADFSTDTLQARRNGKKLQVIKSKDLQPRLLYLARLPIKGEGQIKSFPAKEG